VKLNCPNGRNSLNEKWGLWKKRGDDTLHTDHRRRERISEVRDNLEGNFSDPLNSGRFGCGRNGRVYPQITQRGAALAGWRHALPTTAGVELPHTKTPFLIAEALVARVLLHRTTFMIDHMSHLTYSCVGDSSR